MALPHLLVVYPEEVTVQNRLDDTRHDGDVVDAVIGLGEVSPDPVGNVEGAVQSQSEQVVCCDRLGLTGALQHEQLRKDSNRFEPDAEGPEDLPHGELIGENDRHHEGAAEEVLHAESVDIGIVGRLVSRGHQVDDVALGANKEDLKDDVVDAGC